MPKCRVCGEMIYPVSGNPHRCSIPKSTRPSRSGLTPEPKATMTLNMPAREMAMIDELSERLGMSKTAIARQSLRLYQSHMERISRGERQYWRDKEGKEIEMVFTGGCGWEGMD